MAADQPSAQRTRRWEVSTSIVEAATREEAAESARRGEWVDSYPVGRDTRIRVSGVRLEH
jgi:hypothetical protein